VIMCAFILFIFSDSAWLIILSENEQ